MVIFYKIYVCTVINGISFIRNDAIMDACGRVVC